MARDERAIRHRRRDDGRVARLEEYYIIVDFGRKHANVIIILVRINRNKHPVVG